MRISLKKLVALQDEVRQLRAKAGAAGQVAHNNKLALLDQIPDRQQRTLLSEAMKSDTDQLWLLHDALDLLDEFVRAQRTSA